MSYTNPEHMTESLVERRLEELKAVPERDPLQAASGRARFLRESLDYQQDIALMAQLPRNGWIFPIRKQKFAMNTLVALILVASLLLGGGATVAAAQDDLPTQSLYQVKLWIEDATLAFNDDPHEQAGLLMDMAQTRVEEITALAEMGTTPPDQVRERLEKHIRQALLLAAEMDDATGEQVLLQLQDWLQKQDHLLEKLQSQPGTQTGLLLAQTRQMLQTDLLLVDEGLADPQNLRDKVKKKMPYGQEKKNSPESNQRGERDHENRPQGEPGQGNGNGNGQGNDSPGDPDPDSPQGGNGSDNGGGSGNNPGGGRDNH